MLVTFNNFRLDTDRRELKGAEGAIHVEPQVFDLLLYFARNPNRVISKDELIEHVWKGRVVSDAALNSRINSARRALGESGENQAVIRTVPRHGFLFAAEVSMQTPDQAVSSTTVATSVGRADLKLPDKPSIAVLPFQNLSGDPEQEYFADGTVEDIIMALSRMRWLFVIARNSSFTYKGRAVDVKQVGRELGVRYVLEGSVRKAAKRVRISGQLIDTSTGAHLWADRFEGALEDIFDLQDQVTASVVGAIAPQLEYAEIERAKRKPTESLNAYDYYLRGIASFYRLTKEANNEALRLFTRAIELDPDFAAAYGMAAWCYVWRKLNGWMINRTQEVAEGGRLARRAVELGRDEAIALSRGGHALALLLHEVEVGVVFTDRALVLNPNLATAWYLSGWMKAFLGELDTAIDHLTRAMRLSPLDSTQFNMQVGIAFSHMLAGHFDEASSWVEKPYRDRPDYAPVAGVAASSHALGGRMKEAREAMERLRRIDPSLRVSNLSDWYPLRPSHLALYAQGLRKAGLPE